MISMRRASPFGLTSTGSGTPRGSTAHTGPPRPMVPPRSTRARGAPRAIELEAKPSKRGTGGLQAAHPAQPPFVVRGLPLEVVGHFGMRENQEPFLSQGLDDCFGDLVRFERGLTEQSADTRVRSAGQHLRSHALRAQYRHANALVV